MPRPYECVRRAWHSERHHPIRGSLIQEVFRLANEVHSVSTRKNKEWQEKLPFVVIKAEEIMYSKANSEAEYMDLNTLWKRANDAIDTIIRKDDSTESGDLLKPCIEAALILGCVPRRASRSQRNNNRRCYLSSGGAKDSIDASTLSPDGKIRQQQQGVPFLSPIPIAPSDQLGNNSQQFAPWFSSLCAPVSANCGSFRPGPGHPLQDFRDSVSAENFYADQDRHLNSPPESCSRSGTTGCVYPLLYVTEKQQILKQKFHLPNPVRLNRHTINAHGSIAYHRPRDSIPSSLEASHSGNSHQERELFPHFEARKMSNTGGGHVCSSQYCGELQNDNTHLSCLGTPSNLNSNTAATSSLPGLPTRESLMHNFLGISDTDSATIEASNPENLYGGVASALECDLSLHLGPASIHGGNKLHEAIG